MSSPRPILLPAEEIDSHDALLQREAVAQRRRRIVRWLAVLGAVAVLTGVGFEARPALHVVKAWQARRLSREAMRLLDAGDFEGAKSKVQDAVTIWRSEPEAMRAAALLLTRLGGYRQALSYWEELEKAGPLSPDDLREYTTAEINLGEIETAEAHLRQVWPAGQPGTPTDWYLGMQIAARRSHSAEAAALARQLLAAASTSPRVRLAAAVLLLSGSPATPENQALAWTNIEALSRDERTPESLTALLLLAQQSATPGGNQAAKPTTVPLSELLARIEAHPLAKTQHHLLVLDLRMAQEPAKRAEFIQSAVDRFGGSKDDADLAALGAWLYQKGEFDKVLTVITPERAAGERALYLQYLDTLAAMGRWTEIRQLIQAQKFSLDPMLAEMFLARCAAQLGEPDVRDARWEGAVNAAGTDANKLLTVGQYAEKNGATGVALKAFQAALRVSPETRAVHEALVHLLGATGQTREMRAAVAEMAARWPDDLFVRNEAAYLDALLEQNVPAARDTARDLVRCAPDNLGYRITLALAELRGRNGFAALDAFKGIDFQNATGLQPRLGAVYAAALWQTSYEQEAKEVLKRVPMDQLLPEERRLTQTISGSITP